MAITIEDLNKAINGKATISRMGQSRAVKLTAVERREYEQGIERGCCAVKSGSRQNLHDAFYLYCQIERKPCVIVRKKRTLAVVTLNMWPARDLNEVGMDLAEAAFRQSGADDIFIGNVDCQSHSVPVANAESLALALVAIAGDESNLTKR